MVVEPTLNERVGIGVLKPGFAESLEAGDGGLPRIGNQAVNGLLAVDIGLVLEVAAEGVADRFEKETQNADGEDEDDEAGASGEK
jgi:hypothetical protein